MTNLIFINHGKWSSIESLNGRESSWNLHSWCSVTFGPSSCHANLALQ